MTTLRDIIFEDIRADYLDRGSGSVLYRFLKEGKLKEKCESEPAKEEARIEKAAVDLMYNHGYPLSKRDPKKGSRTSNTALDLMDSWYLERGKYCPAFASEEVNETEWQELFEALNRERRTKALIPVKIDRLTTAGLYIMGKDLLPENPRKKDRSRDNNDFSCGFAIIGWAAENENKGMRLKFIEYMNNDLEGCISVKDALGIFKSSLIAGKDEFSFGGMEDYLFDIRNTNKNMPENCPESLKIYFADHDETDDFEISDEDLRSAREEYESL